jgi:hypothetical protein
MQAKKLSKARSRMVLSHIIKAGNRRWTRDLFSLMKKGT